MCIWLVLPWGRDHKSCLKRRRRKKKKKKELPINEVFDILPVSGILNPGESETVEFTFYAGHGMSYNGIAVCSIEGGPDY